MRYIRHSTEPLTEVWQSILQDGSDHRGTKPNGVWFSIVGEDGRDGWMDYCNGKGIKLGQYRTEIVLNEDSVQFIGSAAEIDKLTTRYGYFPECPAEFLRSDPNYTRSAICWRRLAEEYDGIIIAPECTDRRQENHWYYTWDCASGCIWSSNAVKELKQL